MTQPKTAPALAAAEITSRKVEFDGYHRLETVTCKPRSLKHDGYATEMSREIFFCKKIAAVLLYVPETDEILMNQQFRLGAMLAGAEDPFLFEVAAGAVDEGESIEDAARREALEETGSEVLEIEYINKCYTSAGCLAEEFHLYFGRIARAEGGIYGMEHEGEEIKTHLLPATKVIEMLDNGDITNAPTALLVHWFARNHDRIRAKWAEVSK